MVGATLRHPRRYRGRFEQIIAMFCVRAIDGIRTYTLNKPVAPIKPGADTYGAKTIQPIYVYVGIYNVHLRYNYVNVWRMHTK